MASVVSGVARETRLLVLARWMLFVTAACLPLYAIRWRYGPLPTTLLETLIVVTAALYVVARLRDGLRRPAPTPYDIPIVLLLIAGAISIFVAKDHRGALGLYRAYFIEPVVIYYVAVDLLRRTEDLRGLLIAFAIGSSAFSILNMYVFTVALLANNVHVGNAPNALYGDANYVAMYLDPPIALAAGLVLLSDSTRLRWIGAGWLAITGAAVVLTFSKGSYLALVALALLVVLSVRRRRAALVLGLIAAAIVLSQIPLIAQRLANAYGSIAGRSEIFRATLGMLRESPIFGVGLGGYSYLFRGTEPTLYPHDLWLTFWVETGILGLVAFVVIQVGLLWRGWRAWHTVTGFERALLWGVLAAFVMWAVHGVFDSPYWKNDLSVEFWILAALEVVIVRGVLAAATEPEPRSSTSLRARPGS